MRSSRPLDEDGYELWLRYRPLSGTRLGEYRAAFTALAVPGEHPTLRAAAAELRRGLEGLLAIELPGADRAGVGAVIAGTPASSPEVAAAGLAGPELGEEGFAIAEREGRTLIAANGERGVLYGAFHFLRQLQTLRPIAALAGSSAPAIRLRVLNHWDNLDGTIERGYAGGSLWDWHKLPDYVAPRYTDYARACASIGINGASLTNVNASALVLTHQYLLKVAALAEVLRPYGIRAYLSARFSAPVELGDLDTADPRDARVIRWWARKADEIYSLIPDFGGFVVKANSERQPGPQDYGRSHAEGANLLAGAVGPHGGAVFWRAFVYDPDILEDRAKQAYNEFVPLDGKFLPNVLVQVKNGPIDFQPREPHHPLFGAMPQTPLAIEFQLTQEYLGGATHLVYLGPLMKEALDADTFSQGPASTVARIVSGELEGHALSGIAGVANTGNDRNWCGHPFASANWYAFGRTAWDPRASVDAVADEWLRMTFSGEEAFVGASKSLMLGSREAAVDYMTPLGLAHLMAENHHYGPAPWFDEGRADWTSVYYHRADAAGLGFDRSPSGSNAVGQYFSPLRERYAALETCPENLLLWFHHVAWQHRLRSGRTLWEEVATRYSRGVEWVRYARRAWDAIAELIDEARFEHVRALLRVQEKEARLWRNACLAYFQSISRLPFPAGCEPPPEPLSHYRQLCHYFVPGIPERRVR